jgi:pimeloyl-ACP methyl ester carboxylesterase
MRWCTDVRSGSSRRSPSRCSCRVAVRSLERALYQRPRPGSPAAATFPRLVDIGGSSLWIDCRGSGGPTVVMETGTYLTHESWGPVDDRISNFTRTCVYDRASYGESDGRGVTGKISPAVIADELWRLLGGVGVEPPYVLVGHSLGGVYVRAFEGEHPEAVAGIVLEDPVVEANLAPGTGRNGQGDPRSSALAVPGAGRSRLRPGDRGTPRRRRDRRAARGPDVRPRAGGAPRRDATLVQVVDRQAARGPGQALGDVAAYPGDGCLPPDPRDPP